MISIGLETSKPLLPFLFVWAVMLKPHFPCHSYTLGLGVCGGVSLRNLLFSGVYALNVSNRRPRVSNTLTDSALQRQPNLSRLVAYAINID